MKTWLMSAAAVALPVIGITVAPALRAQDGTNNSQLFPPSRFAVVAAEVNVSSLQPGAGNTQKVLIKMDSVTGQVWVLQLGINGKNNPEVTSASWYPVTQN